MSDFPTAQELMDMTDAQDAANYVCDLDHESLPFRYCATKDCTWTDSPVVPPVEEEPAQPPALPDFETAFTVIVMHNGDITATTDLETKFTIARPASVKDMRRAASELVADIALNSAAVQSANSVMEMMQKIALAEQEKQQNALIASKLAQRGITLPGH